MGGFSIPWVGVIDLGMLEVDETLGIPVDFLEAVVAFSIKYTIKINIRIYNIYSKFIHVGSLLWMDGIPLGFFIPEAAGCLDAGWFGSILDITLLFYLSLV